ncbi:hypothetical protein [Nocardiopsis metallicus]|uniref:Uncharacterized protein n=1 Tax=Nocardiopsis metallicus TaxID=179819 RepID=A0A840W3Q1_9ACTN|nr:hypothetical protein [Nocardiopsis metallicus]MBB5491509.1 hypothetical protein [Nocardiopsis metallicus]
MGRDAKRAKQARRDKRRRQSAPTPTEPVPAFPEKEMLRLGKTWDRAIDLGLMASGQDVKYHFAPDGGVLSVAEGKSGQVLANGERLTPAVAERLRAQMPLLAEVVTFYERNQIDNLGLGGAPQDGLSALPVPRSAGPVPAMDERALRRVQAATEELVAQGLVKEGAGMIVTPSEHGVLMAVGGRNGELYANGRALSATWADRLRAQLPDLASDVDRLQAIRAEWQDGPPRDRSMALEECNDPNCLAPH